MWTGDAILSVNGYSITGSRDLAQQIASLSPDTTVKLGIPRSREERVVIVKLGRSSSGESVKTEQPSAASQFNGEWRVVYAYNEQCVARNRRDVGHWTISDGVVIGRLRGDRGTVSIEGEVRIELRGERIFAVGAQLNGSQGRGHFQIEGRRCGGTVSIQRMSGDEDEWIGLRSAQTASRLSSKVYKHSWHRRPRALARPSSD